MKEEKHSSGASNYVVGASERYPQDGKDIHYDAYLTPISSPLEKLSASIFAQAEELRSEGAKQKPRKDAVANRMVLTANIISNLMGLHETCNTGGAVIVSMGQLKRTRYDRPAFHTKMLRGQLEILEELGWIEREEAVYKKLRTKIKASDALLKEFSKLGKCPHVGREDGGEPIVLRTKSPDDGTKLLVDYEDTNETRALRAEMNVLNETIKGADIRLDGRRIMWAHLVRNFQSDGMVHPPRFDLVGRLSGGFWMSLEKSRRGFVTIDGEGLCDLDYRSSFVSLAYHEAGRSQPHTDAYEGVDGLTRSELKTGLLALLCRSGAMQRLPRKLAHLSREGWTGPIFEETMKKRHPQIAHLFGKAIGLHLMWLEANILMEALLELAGLGVPALGMHDGMMVAESRESIARDAMLRASKQMLGEALTVVSKPLSDKAFSTSSH